MQDRALLLDLYTLRPWGESPSRRHLRQTLPGRAKVGGKATQLHALSKAGLNVPRGFVLSVEALEAQVRRIVGADQAENEDVMAHLLRTSLPAELERQLVQAAKELGGPVAVRSSGVGEDGSARSHAGMFSTVLGVAASDVPQAVRRVWASAFSGRAVAYQRGRQDHVGMAVVVQRMVDPVVSGVMFTVNPLTGSWREMVVESVWGLGEGLVSGEIAPHWSLIRRPHRVPGVIQRLWSRVRLEVMQQDLPPLKEHWVMSGGSVVRTPTPLDLRGQPTLEKRTLLRVCRVGLRVEAAMGAPQDVEWCIDAQGRIQVIQARPITSSASPRARSDVLWTRRFIGERFAAPVTPMGWSILEPLLRYFIAYPDTQDRYLGGGPPLRLVNSRPYINATVFRHLMFKMPGAPPPQFMLELLPPSEEIGWRSRHGAPPDLSVYVSVLKETFAERRWERFAFNPFTNPARWRDLKERLDAELPRLSGRASSPEEAISLVNSHIELMREYISVHITSLLFANLSYQLLDSALSSWCSANSAEWLEALAVCPPGNRTLEANAAVIGLAAAAGPGDLSALANDQPLSKPFSGALEAFLVAYGHRSDASWTLFADRWRNRPSMLVPLISAATSGGVDPRVDQSAQEARFERVQGSALRQVTGWRRVALRALIRYNREYLLLRENQRFTYDKLSWSLRMVLDGIGCWLVAEGDLDSADDVRFLTWDEARMMVTGALDTAAARQCVSRRKLRFEADCLIEPPTFLLGDEAIVAMSGGTRLQGVGISAGRARGRVRVVDSVQDGQNLQAGEILVARSVDPGWTPLFLTAAAVVLELGGMLSHGAVVAREYRVPMVVNLDGVTRSLTDGQEITVDGTRGIVWIHTR